MRHSVKVKKVGSIPIVTAMRMWHIGCALVFQTSFVRLKPSSILGFRSKYKIKKKANYEDSEKNSRCITEPRDDATINKKCVNIIVASET